MVSSSNGYSTLLALSGDGSEVSAVADAELRVVGIGGTFSGLDTRKGFIRYLLWRAHFGGGQWVCSKGRSCKVRVGRTWTVFRRNMVV